jgi:hypothetical protein
VVEPTEERAEPRFLADAVHGLRSAIGRVPLWLLCALVPAFSALLVAQPWYRWYADAVQHHYEPGALVPSLDEDFLADHRDAIGYLSSATGQLGAVLALITMLAYAFCAGGWLQVFLERTDGQSVRRFFYGGSRYFWRFFRVLLCTTALLHLGNWLLYGKPWEWLVHGILLGGADDSLESLGSETSAAWVDWIQSGLYALFFAATVGWGIYTRTRLALQGTRSAVWASFGTFFLILRRPVATLGPLALLLVVEQAGLSLLGAFSSGLERGIDVDSGTASVWSLVALTLISLLWRAVILGAGYAAAVRVSRAIVPPLAQPDPWQARAGGPGGPQYPIGGDEYEVAI